MSSNNNASASTSVSINFAGLLGIVFIVLKLCHVIEWSWLWVFSPIWISLGLVVICLLVSLIITLISYLIIKSY